MAKFTEENKTAAILLRCRGLSYAKIGTALGLNYQTVRVNLDAKAREKARESTREWREANPEKSRESTRKWKKANPEKAREHVRKWQKENPEKARENVRKWGKANPEKVRERTRKWQKANPEKNRESSRNWQKANPEKARENRRKWEKENPLQTKLRNRLSMAIKNKQKSGSAVRDLGCSIEYLTGWLESQIPPWTELSEYHIDHVRPLASFDLEDREQFLAAAHWSNLQPLTPEENWAKNDSVDEELIELHRRKAKLYLAENPIEIFI